MLIGRHLQLLFICLMLLPAALYADEVEYQVSGIEEPMLTNVRNHVTAFRIGGGAKLTSRLRRRLIEDTKTATLDAMRPYGYFHPVVVLDIAPVDEGKWILRVKVTAGPPVLVRKLELELTGPGREIAGLEQWFMNFPLTEGKILRQEVWDKSKLEAIELLEEAGYLQARFSKHTMRVDPMANTASLELILDTGPQAVIGKVTFKQDILQDTVLASLQRFKTGDAYNVWLLGKFRLDLWRSGFFEDIELVERRHLDADPPSVDLEVNFKPRKKNTYQGTIGFGSDTLVRLQFLWGRHLLSSRGDNLDIGFGWQQKNNELTFQANYRLPRKTETRQFWIASFGLKSENQTLRVSPDDNIEEFIDIAYGKINDYSVRLGKTRVRNLKKGYEQVFETIYVQYLNEDHEFEPIENPQNLFPELGGPDSSYTISDRNSQSLALGLDWDWPEIRGNGFKTTGHHERAWIFTSNEAWGSDIDFSQVYLSSRLNFLLGDQWKFLFRAEAGYSDARTIEIDNPTLGSISATELPFLYRFKAGGSRSVRGYAFEVLDDNGLGSNNILTASAEAEYHFHKNWSVAAFADIGNAFNDWSKPDLKFGSGFGLRWYSVIGALRLDMAKGWDLPGDPWRIHITIGTPLL